MHVIPGVDDSTVEVPISESTRLSTATELPHQVEEAELLHDREVETQVQYDDDDHDDDEEPPRRRQRLDSSSSEISPLQESSLADADPVDIETTTFEVEYTEVQSASRRGGRKLIDNQGYSYVHFRTNSK